MNGAREVELIWRGPFKVPHLRDMIARYPQCDGPHVYAYALRYRRCTYVYVGQTGRFKSRMLQEIRDFLSLGYWVRDCSGKPVYTAKPDQFIGALDERLREVVQRAAEDVERLAYYCARYDADDRKSIEAALIDRVMNRQSMDSSMDEFGELKTDNSKREGAGRDGERILVKNRAYDESGEVARFVEYAFGSDPIEWGK